MPIPTENVGSLPRPTTLQEAIAAYDSGSIAFEDLAAQQDAACKDSIQRMEATGSPIVSDGEQRASSFATYRSPTPWPARGSPRTWPATGSTSQSSTTATTASCPG